MFREFVTVQDAIVAVTCVECSMQNSALLGSMNALHTRFPDEPQEEYSRQAKLVLKRLNLEDMVGAIDEVQSIDNGNKDGDSDNGAENDLQPRNTNLPIDKDKEQSSSNDEENERLANNGNISNDFSEIISPEQLTGVFPIPSSEVDSEAFIDRDALAESPICETPSQSKETRDIENSNEKTCFKNPPTLRTVVNIRETVDSAKADNGTTISTSSLDKSKNIIQFFSKKPLAGVSEHIAKNNNEASQRENSSIFMTEELDDEDLEVEWPTDVLSSFQKESIVNNSSSLLRGRSEDSLTSNLLRFNSKKR